MARSELTRKSIIIPDSSVFLETSTSMLVTVPDHPGGMSDKDTDIIYPEDVSDKDNIYPEDECDKDSISPASQSRRLISCLSVYQACDPALVIDSADYREGEVAPDLEGGCLSSLVQDQTEMFPSHLESVECVKEHAINGVIGPLNSQPMSADGSEGCFVTKKRGGWPKGRKRKQKPAVIGPRAPVTGYVLFATDRRKEIKDSHPDIAFPEVTRILGKEWSCMAAPLKEKYLAAAEADKKRYREELKTLRSSETYQETVRKKMLLAQEGNIGDVGSSTELLNCDEETSDELHCKICNVYFSNLHNKREHIYGKVHIQNITEAVEKELLQQQQDEQMFMDGTLVVSEDVSQDGCGGATARNPVTSNSGSGLSEPGQLLTGPVDIHGFMMEFIHKNYEREQEISVLKRCLARAMQENVAMCQEIQTLQEYKSKLEEEMKSLATTTSSLIVQSDGLKIVPTLFGIISL